jgi:hypothetical protein
MGHIREYQESVWVRSTENRGGGISERICERTGGEIEKE